MFLDQSSSSVVREWASHFPIANGRGRRGSAPSILAIGDSWFFYPMPGGSLINTLRSAVGRKQHTIHAVGRNGAALRDLVDGKLRGHVTRNLHMHGANLAAVIISGGGNDIAGWNDLRPMLNDDCSLAVAADECFKQGAVQGTLGALMQRVTAHYDTLLDEIFRTANEQVRVVLHDYDNALPTGKSFLKGHAAWFKPAFDAVGVPVAVQRSCVLHVLDRFTATLENIVARHGGRVLLVHSRGTLAASEWANELHPTAEGFRKIATHAWCPVLREIGIA